MLVVVLIGIALTFVVLNPEPDPRRALAREAERVSVLLQELVDESILRGRVLALEFNAEEQRYGFSVLAGATWQPLADEVFRPRSIASPAVAVLTVEGESEEDDDKAPSRIVADPAIGLSAFVFALEAAGLRLEVTLDDHARVVVQKAERAG